MRNFFLIACLLLALLLVFRSCDSQSEQSKLVDKALYNTSVALENRYQLYEGATSVGGIVGTPYYYERIGLDLDCYKVLSKYEGRKILVDCAETLLNEINSNQKLLHFLKPSPFTIKNIDISIFAHYHDRKSVFYPEIAVFVIRRGIISYRTNTPEKPYVYHTEEKETYEEAKKIIQEHLNTAQNLNDSVKI